MSGDSTSRGSDRSALGHVHLRVRDIDRSVRFYGDLLDLSVTERSPRYAFLAFGDRHHDLALQAVGADAPGPSRGVGLHHTAFEVPTAAALRGAAETLREWGVDVSAVDHRISKALYFDDPDGNGVEVYLDTRAETGRETWGGDDRAFDPASL